MAHDKPPVLSKHSAREVNEAKEAIIAIFRAFRVGVGQHLAMASLMSRSKGWSEAIQRQREAAIASLVIDGFIRWQQDEDGFAVIHDVRGV